MCCNARSAAIPLADIAARADAHPQPVARVLVDIGPIGAAKAAAFGFRHREHVATVIGNAAKVGALVLVLGIVPGGLMTLCAQAVSKLFP